MPSYCCDGLKEHAGKNCQQHGQNCPDKAIKWSDYYKSFQLQAVNGNYHCSFCPFCGGKLPEVDENRPPIMEWLNRELKD